MDGIRVQRFHVPESELQWSFAPSGGPGGQHANRSNTRAELRYDLADSDVFPGELRAHMVHRLGSRLTKGVIAVTVDESRSQFRNRALARQRLAEILTDAMRRPIGRRSTRPTRASKRRRLESKRHRSEIKKLRRSPDQT